MADRFPTAEDDTDEDLDRPCYAVGPGRRRITGGPVIEAYADGAIDHPCPSCGAEPLSFCRHDSGAHRKMPCLARTRAATTAARTDPGRCR